MKNAIRIDFNSLIKIVEKLHDAMNANKPTSTDSWFVFQVNPVDAEFLSKLDERQILIWLHFYWHFWSKFDCKSFRYHRILLNSSFWKVPGLILSGFYSTLDGVGNRFWEKITPVVIIESERKKPSGHHSQRLPNSFFFHQTDFIGRKTVLAQNNDILTRVFSYHFSQYISSHN